VGYVWLSESNIIHWVWRSGYPFLRKKKRPYALGTNFSFGFFIRVQKATQKGHSLWKVTNNSVEKIYFPNSGYIIANSRYNYINYKEKKISLHIRRFELSSSYEYYADEVVILDFYGQVIGHFWFRDLAMFICGSSLYTWKHWRHFIWYFLNMTTVRISKKRMVMTFTKNSPFGVQVLKDPMYNFYYVHPDYEPTSKIRSAVISYNFYKDHIEQSNSREEYDKKLKEAEAGGTDLPDPSSVYNIEDFKVKKNDKFFVETPIDITAAFAGAGGMLFPFYTEGGIKADDCKKLECFEYISEMPLSALTNMEDSEVDANRRATHTGLNINHAQAEIYNIGAAYWSYLMPSLRPAKIYHSTDSDVMSIWIDMDKFDKRISEEFEKSALMQLAEYFRDNGMEDAAAYINMIRKFAGESMIYKNVGLIHTFWRYGPHQYLFYTTAGLAGIVVYPIIEYDRCWYFLNQELITPPSAPVSDTDIMAYQGRMVCLDKEKITDNLYYIRNKDVYKIMGEQEADEEPFDISNFLDSLDDEDLALK